MPAKLLTVAEACQRQLHISPQRGYQMAREGILPPGVVVRLGRQIRLNEAKLEDWIASGGKCLPGGWRRKPNAPAGAPRPDEADQTDPLRV